MTGLVIALRAVGRLLADRRITHDVAAGLVGSAFHRSGLAEAPSEKAAAMNTNPHASPSGTYIAGLWCGACQSHMVTLPSELCPCCREAS